MLGVPAALGQRPSLPLLRHPPGDGDCDAGEVLQQPRRVHGRGESAERFGGEDDRGLENRGGRGAVVQNLRTQHQVQSESCGPQRCRHYRCVRRLPEPHHGRPAAPGSPHSVVGAPTRVLRVGGRRVHPPRRRRRRPAWAAPHGPLQRIHGDQPSLCPRCHPRGGHVLALVRALLLPRPQAPFKTQGGLRKKQQLCKAQQDWVVSPFSSSSSSSSVIYRHFGDCS
mmetsp:Transcript_62413/g.125023  ORF Transcript_62413/g.125023 Transcript_62413/m.125023 type:complete len:225 (-) Transcript_62413:101-775(-)